MNKFLRMRRLLRNVVSTHPSIYCPLARLGSTGYRVVAKDTDLVIEGYPRSGNSYVEAAFKLSQPKGTKLAHHTHAAANVLKGHQLGKPCYVLVRAPEDAATSLVIQEPDLVDLSLALIEYDRFHRCILPIADQICLIPFEAATKDFNASVEHLNACYGTDFKILPIGTTREEVMIQVNQTSRERQTVPGGIEPYSPEASTETRLARKQKKADLLAEMRKPRNADLLLRCQDTYKAVLSKVRLAGPS